MVKTNFARPERHRALQPETGTGIAARLRQLDQLEAQARAVLPYLWRHVCYHLMFRLEIHRC